MDTGYDEDIPESRHGKYAAGTRRFLVTFRGTVPDDMVLWDDVRDLAKRLGVSVADFTRDALQQQVDQHHRHGA